jgi:hypothetical protein
LLRYGHCGLFGLGDVARQRVSFFVVLRMGCGGCHIVRCRCYAFALFGDGCDIQLRIEALVSIDDGMGNFLVSCARHW